MDITADIITAFRTAYPAFNDGTAYPDPVVSQVLCYADAETGSSRWGVYADDCHNLKQRGMFAWAAHYLAVTYPNGTGSTNGGAQYATASKSVGDESVSFAVPTPASVNESGTAWLASSAFGQQFMYLRRRVGMGALAV